MARDDDLFARLQSLVDVAAALIAAAASVIALSPHAISRRGMVEAIIQELPDLVDQRVAEKEQQLAAHRRH